MNMEVALVTFLAICAYGHAASIKDTKLTIKEVAFASSDQEIHRVGCIHSNTPMMWHEAQLACVKLGFNNLLSVKNAGEQEAAEFTMATCNIPLSGSPWIGLHRAKTWESWTWGDGTELGSYTNWYSGNGESTTDLYSTQDWYSTTDGPPSNTLGGVRMWSDSDWGLWYTGSLASASEYCLCEG